MNSKKRSRRRPSPPEKLHPSARELWIKIVASRPPETFRGIYAHQLAQFCSLVEIEKQAWILAGGDFVKKKKQARALACANRMSRLMLRTAETLCLTKEVENGLEF